MTYPATGTLSTTTQVRRTVAVGGEAAGQHHVRADRRVSPGRDRLPLTARPSESTKAVVRPGSAGAGRHRSRCRARTGCVPRSRPRRWRCGRPRNARSRPRARRRERCRRGSRRPWNSRGRWRSGRPSAARSTSSSTSESDAAPNASTSVPAESRSGRGRSQPSRVQRTSSMSIHASSAVGRGRPARHRTPVLRTGHADLVGAAARRARRATSPVRARPGSAGSARSSRRRARARLAARPSSSGAIRCASCLPSSTPHWSNALMSQIDAPA